MHVHVLIKILIQCALTRARARHDERLNNDNTTTRRRRRLYNAMEQRNRYSSTYSLRYMVGTVIRRLLHWFDE